MEDGSSGGMIEDYFGHTVVHPLALAVMLLLGIAMLFVPKRWVFVPMIVLACFVSAAQRVVVVGFNFDFPRILILFGWARLLLRGEIRPLNWNGVDRCVIAFASISVLAYCALHGDADSLKYKLGWAYDVFGFYFLFRQVFIGDCDPKFVGRAFAAIAVPCAVCFAIEFTTHRNMFAVFGGVAPFTWIRDGRLRCQGAFAHPIIAGVYWASVLPLMASMFTAGGKWRAWSVVGVGSASVIILCTNSSTPATSVIFGTLAFFAFVLRRRMLAVRIFVVALVVILHLCMKAPVWHLLARLTVFDASTGWYRYFLIDQSLRHMGDWWFIGTLSTDSWDVWDITNEYIMTGIEAGAFGLLAFLGMIWFAFREVGVHWRRVVSDRAQTFVTWSLGVALYVHCMNFIAVSYFGQARMVWYLLLALIASQATSPAGVRLAAPLAAGPTQRPRWKWRMPPAPEPQPSSKTQPASEPELR